jgi:hypothetical protein
MFFIQDGAFNNYNKTRTMVGWWWVKGGLMVG